MIVSILNQLEGTAARLGACLPALWQLCQVMALVLRNYQAKKLAGPGLGSSTPIEGN